MNDDVAFVDSLRRLIAATRRADLSPLDLAEAIETIDRLTELVDTEATDGVRMQAGLTMDAVAERLATTGTARLDRAFDEGIASFFPYSPYVGPLNPIAPPVELRVEPGDPWAEIHGLHHFDDVVNGPPGSVHGGVIAGVFDEVLGSVCVTNDVAGFTGTLQVRYESLTPLGAPITIRGWVDRVEGRKTFATGTFHHGDVLTAKAEGIFIGGSAAAGSPIGVGG